MKRLETYILFIIYQYIYGLDLIKQLRYLQSNNSNNNSQNSNSNTTNPCLLRYQCNSNQLNINASTISNNLTNLTNSSDTSNTTSSLILKNNGSQQCYITVPNISITISSCPDGQYCPYNSSSPINTNFNCINKSFIFSGHLRGELVEFDKCYSDSDCASNNCTKGVCYGYGVNSSCTSNSQCSSGTYCDMRNLICSPRKAINQSCHFDIECNNQYGCFNFSCTPYYSLPAGANINSSVVAINYSLINNKFCKSGFVDGSGICVDLINSVPAPYYCNTSIGCTYYYSNNNTITGNITLPVCNCDPNGSGYAYCPLDTNTTEYQNYVNSVSNLFNDSCHFSNKGNCPYTNYTSILQVYNAQTQYYQLNNTNLTCLQPSKIMKYCDLYDCFSSVNSVNLLLTFLFILVFLF